MKILILSKSDSVGGAAKASFRLFTALNRASEITCKLFVDSKNINKSGIIEKARIKKAISKVANFVERVTLRAQKTNNPILHSLNFIPVNSVGDINQIDADVCNVHWVNGSSISIGEISRINKPIVMTLHDMWAFCGAEHYVHDDKQARFKVGYKFNNKVKGDCGIDINHLIWRLKKAKWDTFYVVTPSEWLTECASKSEIFNGWPIYTIPNALDTSVFKPISKSESRKLLNIPVNSKVIGFGALDGGKDPRKGFDLLLASLVELEKDEATNSTECIIFGQEESEQIKESTNLKLHFFGHINDDYTLALIYNAMDVMVVPSRQEAFGQTASEAQACGIPVVAFNATGLKDIVLHKKTGYLADAYSSLDLSNGIKWCLNEIEVNTDIAERCSSRANELWSYDVVSTQYKSIFTKAQGG